MRNGVEDLQQTQEASSVNVQPTKQATKPSYKHLGKRQILDDVEFLQDYNAQIEKIVIQKKINR